MKSTNRLLLLAAFLVLLVPMALTVGSAQAAAPWLLDDGAGLADNGQWEVIDPGVCRSNGAQATRAACNAELFGGYTVDDCFGTASCTDGVSSDATTCFGLGYNWVTTRRWNVSDCRGNYTSDRVYGPTVTQCSDVKYSTAAQCTTPPATGTWNTYNNNDTYLAESQRVQCLHCHNDFYGTDPLPQPGGHEAYFRTGHKNVLRKVTDLSVGGGKIPLGGPYYTDNPASSTAYSNVTWATGMAGTQTAYYVYNGWYSALKQAQIKGDAMADPTSVSTVTNYSGGRTCFYCHTSAYNLPEARYPVTGETFEASVTGAALYKFELGITCVTCHKGVGHEWADYSIEHHTATSTGNYGSFPLYEEATKGCMACHRMEDTGGPISDVLVQDDALLIEEIGAQHANLGAQFLQSPHAKFTGTYAQIDDYREYDSLFSINANGCSDPQYKTVTACTTASETWGLVDHNAGCAECHNVHVGALDPDVLDPTNALTSLNYFCTDCHSGGADPDAPQMVVADINHPTGTNTPLSGNIALDKNVQMACVRCHMGGNTVSHFFEVSTDSTYSTLPQQCTDPSYVTNYDCTANGGNWYTGTCAGGTAPPYYTVTTCTSNGGTWTPLVIEAQPSTDGFAKMDLAWACGWCHYSSAKVGAGFVFNKSELAVAATGMHGGTLGSCATCHPTMTMAMCKHSKATVYTPATCTECHLSPHAGPTIANTCYQCHGGSGGTAAPNVPFLGDTRLQDWVNAGAHNTSPDLFISALTVPSTTYVTTAGGPMPVTVTTKNLGPGAADASLTKLYFSTSCSGTLTPLDSGERSVPALAAGASDGPVVVNATIPAGTANGYYYIIAKADDGGIIAESNEGNNQKCASTTRITVASVASDLIINSVSAPLYAKKSVAFNVSDVTKNRLTGAAGGSTTAVYLASSCANVGGVPSGTVYDSDTRAVPALAGGAGNAGTMSLTAPASAGSACLIWVADSTGGVPESSETNNVKTKAITITN